MSKTTKVMRASKGDILSLLNKREELELAQAHLNALHAEFQYLSSQILNKVNAPISTHGICLDCGLIWNASKNGVCKCKRPNPQSQQTS